MFRLALIVATAAFAQTSDYEQGLALIQKGQYDAAARLLTRAAQAQPQDAQAWKALGVAYASQGLYTMAEPAFHRSCELNPKLEDACYYYGRALYALDRFESSLEVLTRAARTDPGSWKIHLGIAQALEALTRAEQADSAFRKTLSLCRNNDPQPGAAYGRFLVRQGRFDAAIAPLEEVLKRFPNSAEANTHLGRALIEQGKVAEAIRRLEQAVRTDPASAQAHLLLANAYVRSGRMAEAQPHFEAAARYEQASQGAR